MKIIVKGIPSNSGAMNLGTEKAPSLLRNAGLIPELTKVHQVLDLGDVVLPLDLPRHDVPPVRNWPAPRIVWEETIKQLGGSFEEEAFSVIIGGGCSTFTGVFNHFYNQFGTQSHIISIDHHIDMRKPSAEVCMGATAYTLWFLTEENQWFSKPKAFGKDKIYALGYEPTTLDENYDVTGIRVTSKNELAQVNIDALIQDYFQSLEPDARVLIHLDLDVIQESDLKSVYMPSPNGMPITMLQHLLQQIVKDKRVMGIVVTEFSGAYEESEAEAKKVVKFLKNMWS